MAVVATVDVKIVRSPSGQWGTSEGKAIGMPDLTSDDVRRRLEIDKKRNPGRIPETEALLAALIEHEEYGTYQVSDKAAKAIEVWLGEDTPPMERVTAAAFLLSLEMGYE